MFVKHRRHFIIVDDISRFGETAERNSLQETYSGEKAHFFSSWPLMLTNCPRMSSWRASVVQ